MHGVNRIQDTIFWIFVHSDRPAEVDRGAGWLDRQALGCKLPACPLQQFFSRVATLIEGFNIVLVLMSTDSKQRQPIFIFGAGVQRNKPGVVGDLSAKTGK